MFALTCTGRTGSGRTADEFHVLGMYDVELRPTAHGWRIGRLAVIPLFTQGAPAASIMTRAHDAWRAHAAGAGT